MAKTFKERLVVGLLVAGYVEGQGLSRKYAVFARYGELNKKLFVGPNGALRSGRCATDSFSIGDPCNQTEAYKRFLTLADRAEERIGAL